MSHKRFINVSEELIKCACDKFTEITPEKLFFIELKCEIIRQAAIDLHNKKSPKLQREAKEYLNSADFKYECLCLAISPKIVRYIVENPDKHLKKFIEYRRSAA